MLHLLLRITDQLFEAFLKKINTLDGNQDSPDFTKRPLLSKLNELIKEKSLNKRYHYLEPEIKILIN
jgi:hypothetical protein